MLSWIRRKGDGKMGQYLNGKKIGTCECMYYLTLKEAQELAAVGARDDDGVLFSEYLSDNTTRFRFPFPGEDGTSFFEVDREPFKTFALPCPVEVNHEPIVVHNTHFGGGYGMNIWIPCPHDKTFTLKTSNGGAGEQFICVEFEALRDGKVKTIFKCARCGQSQRFDDADIAKIKIRALEYYAVYATSNPGLYDYAMKVIERIH
jgi:hypothetical protein